MDQAIQLLLSGLVVGSIYGLVAIGFTGVYNVTGIVNFAQGDFAMLGGMIAAGLWAQGVALPLAILAGVAGAALASALLQRLGIRPLRGDLVAAVIVTIGAGIVFQGIAVVIWGTDAQTMPAFSGDKPLTIAGATIPMQTLWVIGTALLLVGLLTIFFQFTYAGRAFRACSVNPFAATLCGINGNTMATIAFILSGVLGAIAGIVSTPITLTNAEIGIPLAIKGFTACIVGGLGTASGAMLGGVLLGIAEAFAAGYVSSGFKNAIVFVILLGFLAFRPTGILGDLEKTVR
ncbi:MAG TPA: branched-chain amino acid ABC transporter permease [Burkholderiales bacterium]|nr:branched-chain amino acid ABC transporter permease [Burkholderiales bacterium]